jgi:hypothetical protein
MCASKSHITKCTIYWQHCTFRVPCAYYLHIIGHRSTRVVNIKISYFRPSLHCLITSGHTSGGMWPETRLSLRKLSWSSLSFPIMSKWIPWHMPQLRPGILKFTPQNIIGLMLIVCSTVSIGIFLVERYRLQVSANQESGEHICACVHTCVSWELTIADITFTKFTNKYNKRTFSGAPFWWVW